MKTPGQVGYEAMLELIRSNRELPGYDAHRDPETEHQVGAWENQSDKLKSDWEEVARAIILSVMTSR